MEEGDAQHSQDLRVSIVKPKLRSSILVLVSTLSKLLCFAFILRATSVVTPK